MFLITLSSPSAAGKISKGLSSQIWTINEQTWSRGDIWKWAVCRPLSELIVSCFQHTGVHSDHSWFNTLAVFKVIHRYITSTKHNDIKYCCIFCHSLCLSVCSSISIYLSIYSFVSWIFLHIAVGQINTGTAEIFSDHFMLHLGQMFYKNPFSRYTKNIIVLCWSCSKSWTYLALGKYGSECIKNSLTWINPNSISGSQQPT